MTLQINRYQEVTPSETHPSGCTVSCPIYITPTTDQTKNLLNTFRQIKQRQLIEMGFKEQVESSQSGLIVTTRQQEPLTEIESLLGCNEENLRYALLGSRGGIPEKLFFKLCQLTGLEFITRQDVETTQSQWLDHIFKNGHQDTKAPAKTVAKRSPRKKVESASTK